MTANGAAGKAGWRFWLAWVGLNAVANIGSFFIYSFTLKFLNATFPQLFNTVIVNVIGGLIALLLFGLAIGTIQRYYFAKAFSRQPKRWLLNNILAWEISGVYIVLGFLIMRNTGVLGNTNIFLASTPLGALIGGTLGYFQITSIQTKRWERMQWIFTNAIAYSIGASFISTFAASNWALHSGPPAYSLVLILMTPIVIPIVQAFGLAAMLRHLKTVEETPA